MIEVIFPGGPNFPKGMGKAWAEVADSGGFNELWINA
jgi:hypothetical protein